jgi:hypothetical protein
MSVKHAYEPSRRAVAAGKTAASTGRGRYPRGGWVRKYEFHTVRVKVDREEGYAVDHIMGFARGGSNGCAFLVYNRRIDIYQDWGLPMGRIQGR